MSILLIRHGETALNAARIVQHPETPLNERGVGQARRLAERLADFKLPRAFVEVDALPRTETGKVQKHRLSEGDAGGTA